MITELEERRMSVTELCIGMFVCRLDRPWEETPFALQGLKLASNDDIEAVRAHCDYVYIDARREVAPDALALRRTELAANRFSRTAIYTNDVAVQEELPRAKAALQNAATLVDKIFDDVTSGRELSVEQVEQAVRPLVSSVLRSPDAFFWVEGLREHDSYSYRHAISCSALAAAFGRHMGFAEDTIISLAAGGLLMDVGKRRLPETLLQYQGSLSPDEVQHIRSHVAEGLSIVGSAGITDQDVLDIVGTHHERHDGSGYPNRLIGSNIPISGRMLGIVDAYDAMISARPYRAAISRHHAVRQLYAARDTLFQAELVEQFQVCMGVYPTGSLVELTSGEIAMVMAQNQVRRLRPRVVLLSTPSKQPTNEFRVLDLMEQITGRPVIEIARSLPAGDYGLDNVELFISP